MPMSNGPQSFSPTPRSPPPFQRKQSQHQIPHAMDTPHNMRLERHEMRRHSIRFMLSLLFNDSKEHHDQRLRNILDAPPDVLDALNAMTKIHIDKPAECREILYDQYTDALLFSHRGKPLAPASQQISLILRGI
jgi:hypothetical protein